LIDVLLGKATERVKKFAHEKISTFGIGKELDEQQWYSVFRQLVARGLVTVDFERFGALRLTEACRPILRGEQQLMLRKDNQPDKSKRTKTLDSRSETNPLLWEALRLLRKQLAEAQDVPPYVIFQDVTLQAMIDVKPKNRREMALISGIGERKLELYGDKFLAVINQFIDGTVPDTVNESVNLFRLGFNVAQIAERRGFKESTILGHLAHSIEQGALALGDVIDIPDHELRHIEEAILALPNEQKNTLKPVFEAFQGEYDYGLLRCVQASLK
jgi:ATP-dependent DNA helicase RecQ